MASTISAGTSAGTAIAITGDTTGNLAFQTSAGTYTQTLPNATGTVMVSGNQPAFSAYLSANQTPISNFIFTKVQLNTEEFDTASAYDNATNYRFTPQVAGYYQVNGSVNITSTTNSEILCVIYKNGSAAKWGIYQTRTAQANDGSSIVSALIYLNGSSDYIELYGYIAGTATLQFIGTQTRTYFQAVLVRTA
jgi:hypothetical protein